MGIILFKAFFVCMMIGVVGSFIENEYEYKQEKKQEIIIDSSEVKGDSLFQTE